MQTYPTDEWERFLQERERMWKNSQRTLARSIVVHGQLSDSIGEPDRTQQAIGVSQILGQAEDPDPMPLAEMRSIDDLLGAAQLYGIQDPERIPVPQLAEMVQAHRQQRVGQVNPLALMLNSSALGPLGRLGALQGVSIAQETGRFLQNIVARIPFMGDTLARAEGARKADRWLSMLEEGLTNDFPEGRRDLARGVTGAIGMFPATYAAYQSMAGIGLLPNAAMNGGRVAALGRAMIRGGATNLVLQDPTAPLAQQAGNTLIGTLMGVADVGGPIGRIGLGANIGVLAATLSDPGDPRTLLISAAAGAAAGLATGRFSTVRKSFPSALLEGRPAPDANVADADWWFIDQEPAGLLGPGGQDPLAGLGRTPTAPMSPTAPRPASPPGQRVPGFPDWGDLSRAAPGEAVPPPSPQPGGGYAVVWESTPPQVQAYVGRLLDERRALQRQVDTNPLTGVGSRAAWQKALPTAEADPGMAVVVYDLGNFKAANDNFGHNFGDELLKKAAQSIIGRPFHFGGDEFGALVPADQAQASIQQTQANFGQIYAGGFPVEMHGAFGQTFDEADTALGALKGSPNRIRYRNLDGPSAISEATQLTKQSAILESPALNELSNHAALDDSDVARAVVETFPGQVGVVQNVGDVASTLQRILQEQMPRGVGPQDFRVVQRPSAVSARFKGAPGLEDVTLLSRNTMPGQRPWRTTVFFNVQPGAEPTPDNPFMHGSYDSMQEMINRTQADPEFLDQKVLAQQTDILVSSGRPITNQMVKDYQDFGMFAGQRAMHSSGQEVILKSISSDGAIVEPAFGGPEELVPLREVLPMKSSHIVDDIPGLYEEFQGFAQGTLTAHSLAAGIDPIGLMSNEGATQVPLLMDDFILGRGIDPQSYFGAAQKQLLERRHIEAMRALAPEEQASLRLVQDDLRRQEMGIPDLDEIASEMAFGATPNLVGADYNPRLLETLANLYKGNLAPVIVKEAIQNSFDAIRPIKGPAKINITIRPAQNFFSIQDNGVGMSPEVAAKQYMDPGGTFHEQESSGSFGLAKVVLLLRTDPFQMTTTWKAPDGQYHRTSIEGSGQEWAAKQLRYNTEIVDNPSGETGTSFKATYKSPTPLSWGEAESFIRTLKRHTGGAEIEADMEGRKITNYDPTTLKELKGPVVLPVSETAQYTGGQVKIGYSPNTQKGHTRVHVLNRGLYQFSKTEYTQGTEVPSEVVFDLHPDADVLAESPYYPFPASREELRGEAADLYKTMLRDLQMASAKKKIEKLHFSIDHPHNITGTPYGVYETSAQIDPRFLEFLSRKPYVAHISSVLGESTYALSKILAPLARRMEYENVITPTQVLNFEAGGVGITHGWLGLNVSRDLINQVGMSYDQRQQYLPGMERNLILYNPWLMAQEIELFDPNQMVLNVAGKIRTSSDMLGALSYNTVLHELVHQGHRNHDVPYTAGFTRAGEVMGGSMHEVMRLVQDMKDAWQVVLPHVMRELPEIEKHWKAGENLFQGVSDHAGSSGADDIHGVPGGDGQQLDPGSGAALASASSGRGPGEGPPGPIFVRGSQASGLPVQGNELGAALRGADAGSGFTLEDLAASRGMEWRPATDNRGGVLIDLMSEGDVQVPLESEEAAREFLHALQRELLDDSPVGQSPLELLEVPPGFSATRGGQPGQFTSADDFVSKVEPVLDQALADLYARYGEDYFQTESRGFGGAPPPPPPPAPPGGTQLPPPEEPFGFLPPSSIRERFNSAYGRARKDDFTRLQDVAAQLNHAVTQIGLPMRNLAIAFDRLMTPLGIPPMERMFVRMQDGHEQMVNSAYPWEQRAHAAVVNLRRQIIKDGSAWEVLVAPPEFQASIARRKGMAPEEFKAVQEVGKVFTDFINTVARRRYPDLPQNYLHMFQKVQEGLAGDPRRSPRQAKWGPPESGAVPDYVEKDLDSVIARFFRSYYKVEFMNQPYADMKAAVAGQQVPGFVKKMFGDWADDRMWGLDPTNDIALSMIHGTLNGLAKPFGLRVSMGEIQGLMHAEMSASYASALGTPASIIRETPQMLMGIAHIGFDKGMPVFKKLLDPDYRERAMQLALEKGWMRAGHGSAVDPDVFGGTAFREVNPEMAPSITQTGPVNALANFASDRVLAPLGLRRGWQGTRVDVMRPYGAWTDFGRLWNLMTGYETALEGLARYEMMRRQGLTQAVAEKHLLEDSRVDRFQGTIQDGFLEKVRAADLEGAAEYFARHVGDSQTRFGMTEHAPAFRRLGPVLGRKAMKWGSFNTQMMANFTQILRDPRISPAARAKYFANFSMFGTAAYMAQRLTGWNLMKLAALGVFFNIPGNSIFDWINLIQRGQAWLAEHEPGGAGADPTQRALLGSVGTGYGSTPFTLDPTRATWNPWGGLLRTGQNVQEMYQTYGGEAAAAAAATGQRTDPFTNRSIAAEEGLLPGWYGVGIPGAGGM